MRGPYLCMAFCCAVLTLTAQADANEEEIRALLAKQEMAWNNGDIDGFMQGYLKSDDLHFLSSSGLTKGWETTRNGYKARYPDAEAMGTLRFELHEVTYRTDLIYTVVGTYYLERQELENLSGNFLLVVQRIKNAWKIVADSTHR